MRISIIVIIGAILISCLTYVTLHTEIPHERSQKKRFTPTPRNTTIKLTPSSKAKRSIQPTPKVVVEPEFEIVHVVTTTDNKKTPQDQNTPQETPLTPIEAEREHMRQNLITLETPLLKELLIQEKIDYYYAQLKARDQKRQLREKSLYQISDIHAKNYYNNIETALGETLYNSEYSFIKTEIENNNEDAENEIYGTLTKEEFFAYQRDALKARLAAKAEQERIKLIESHVVPRASLSPTPSVEIIPLPIEPLFIPQRTYSGSSSSLRIRNRKVYSLGETYTNYPNIPRVELVPQ